MADEHNGLDSRHPHESPDPVDTSDPVDDLFSGIEAPKPGEKPEGEGKKPFKFLDSYGPEDREIFFGRELETAEIFSRFYRSRLLVVYGESGSGKTSLIQCGLRSEIPAQDAQFLTIRSATDPIEALRREVLKQVAFADGEVPPSCLELLREAVFLKSKPLALVFDQFEEFFIFQPESVRERFIGELASWLEEDVNVRIILCIRGEYLDRLSELEPALPQLYQNRLWVRRMSRDQAHEAIGGPCRKCGVEIEKELTEELLDVLTRGGKGVELPILQVALDTLYNRAVETSPESPALTLSAYLGLGRIDSILGRFIEDKVNGHGDPEKARQVLKAMVTPEGTRRVSSLREISENAGYFGAPISEDALGPVLNRLIDDRIVREDVDNHLFELRHDTLAQTICRWMTGIEQELMEVRQTIENRYKEFKVRGTLLDTAALEYIAPYVGRLNLKGELAGLVDRSRKEAAKRRRRWLTFLGCAVGLFITVVSTLAVFSYLKSVEATQKTVEANERLLDARHNMGLVFHEKAGRALKEKDFNAARLYSLYALAYFHPGRNSPERAETTGRILSYEDHPILFTASAGLDRGNRVSSVAYSPDGRTLASGGDKTIRIWDVTTGKELSVLTGHTGYVESVVYSPDGSTLASGAGDKTIRLWDVTTGKELSVLRGHTEGINGVVYSPDGRTLASGANDNTIRIWDVTTGKELSVLTGHKGWVICVVYSPDGRTLASGSVDTTIRIWDVTTGKELSVLTDHKGPVYCVVYSPDGRTLASGAGDEAIRLWDVTTGKELSVLMGHTNYVRSVVYSPDGRTLASGADDEAIRLWDVTTGKELSVLTGHTNYVRSVVYSPDGRTLASGSGDTTIRIWDITTGKKLSVLTGHEERVICVAYSPDGRTLASGGSDDGAIRIWDVATGKELSVLTGHKECVRCVVYSPDGRTLASGSDDDTIRVWDVTTWKELSVLKGHKGYVWRVVYSPDGRTLASGSGDKTIRLWDVTTGKELSVLTGHKEWVSSVVYSPDGRTLASGSGDKTIRLWDVTTGKELSVLTGHTKCVRSVVYSPDGRTLASGANDNTIQLWDVSSGRELSVLTGHTRWVSSVAYSPDGRTLASGAGDGTIRLWDLTWLAGGTPLEDQIRQAEDKYNLELDGIQLRPRAASGVQNLNANQTMPPAWPVHHPFHWLQAVENGDPGAMVELGLIYERDDENDKALAWYRKAVDAGDARAAERLDLLNRRTATMVREKAAGQVVALLNQAVEHLERGNWEQAIALCDEAIARDGENADGYLCRGVAHERSGRLDQAAADLRRAIRLAPDSTGAHGVLGWILILQGSFSEARDESSKAHELGGKNLVWTVNLGHACLLLGNPEEARKWYEEVLPRITDEESFLKERVAEFELFIRKGWQVQACREALAWMREAFARRH